MTDNPTPPDSPKLAKLRARLIKATARKVRADQLACDATARLSEAEEREAAIQAEINKESDYLATRARSLAHMEKVSRGEA